LPLRYVLNGSLCFHVITRTSGLISPLLHNVVLIGILQYHMLEGCVKTGGFQRETTEKAHENLNTGSQEERKRTVVLLCITEIFT
jgi:hypothetical protein